MNQNHMSDCKVYERSEIQHEKEYEAEHKNKNEVKNQ
jgi:hypothetical protein